MGRATRRVADLFSGAIGFAMKPGTLPTLQEIMTGLHRMHEIGAFRTPPVLQK